MEIRFNVTGERRKALVRAISTFAGYEPVYMKAPSFAYVIGGYHIDANGTVTIDEWRGAVDFRALHHALEEQGFACDDFLESLAEDDLPAAASIVDATDGESTNTPEEPFADTAAITEADAIPAVDDDPDQIIHHDESYNESPVHVASPDHLAIEVPLQGFTETALTNLEKLIASKAALIKKAVGATDLPILREDDKLRFPWFSPSSSGEEAAAYAQFLHALCALAQKQKRVTAKEKPADSEKFAFRCFLLRLGFIGDEYAAARKILLANLPGNGSFKSDPRTDEVNLSSEDSAIIQPYDDGDVGGLTAGDL